MSTRKPNNRTRGALPTDKWRARVKVMGMEMWLGTYDTKEEADAVEDAYREWRRARQAGEPIHPSWAVTRRSVLNGREYLNTETLNTNTGDLT